MDPLLAPRFMEAGELISMPSDHGAVTLRLALTAHARVKPRWCLDTALLLKDDLVAEVRAAIVARATEQRPASERMERIRQDARAIVAREEQRLRERSERKKQLVELVRSMDEQLGRGIRPSPLDPMLSRLAPRQRDRMLGRRDAHAAELDDILDREATEWLQRRGHEAHMDSRPTKAFFQQLEEIDAERSVPIECIDDNGSTIQDASALVDSATRAFSARFQQQYDEQRSDVQQARARLLHSVRKLPSAASASLHASQVLQCEHVLHAINQMPLHKTPGPDGFPAEFYR